MTAESLQETIKRELPALLRKDSSFRDSALELTYQYRPSCPVAKQLGIELYHDSVDMISLDGV